MKRKGLAIISGTLALALAAPVVADQTRPSDQLSFYDAGTGAHQHVTGTVSALDQKSGLMTLASPDGVVRLQFPPRSLRHVDDGDRITAQYSLVKTDLSARAYDAPRDARDRGYMPYDTARGATGGAGTTRDLAAAGTRYDMPRRAYDAPVADTAARGRTGGAGTTQDLTAAGESYPGRRVVQALRAGEVARGPAGGVGTTQDLLLGAQFGEHYVTGRISTLDRQTGIVTVQAGARTLQLRFAPQSLRAFEQGDEITVQLAFARRA